MRRLPSPATVLAAIALFAALGGSAYAAAEIRSSDIKRDAVRAKHLKKNAVRSGDIKDGVVRSRDVRDGELRGEDVLDGSLAGSDVADGSLAGVDLLVDSIGGDQVDESSLDSSVLQRRVSGTCPAGEAMQSVAANGTVTCEAIPVPPPAGSNAPTGPAGGDLTGTYPDPTIADDAISSAEIINGAVMAADIGTSAVTSDEVLNGSIGLLDLGVNSVSSDEVINGSIAGFDIASDSITVAQLGASSVGTSEIANDSVGTADIDNDAVTASEIAANAVGSSELVTASVRSDEVLDGSLRRVDDSVFDSIAFIDPPSIPAGGCETDVMTGGVFSDVEVGDVGYTYPLASVADGLMVQTGIRQSAAGQFQYKICNISNAAVNDTARVYGVRLVR